MKIISVAAFGLISSVNCDESHEGHDHSGMKPIGPYWGMTVYTSKSNKKWNTNEVQLIFNDNDTVDMKWWYGFAKLPDVNIPKQTFACEALPFTWDEKTLEVSVSPSLSPCLIKINNNFPKMFQLSDPFVLPLDETNGGINFRVARGLIQIDLVPINAPIANVPSGIDGFVPESTPQPRVYEGDVVTTGSPAAAQGLKAGDVTTTTTTTKSYAPVTFASLAVIMTIATLFI